MIKLSLGETGLGRLRIEVRTSTSTTSLRLPIRQRAHGDARKFSAVTEYTPGNRRYEGGDSIQRCKRAFCVRVFGELRAQAGSIRRRCRTEGLFGTGLRVFFNEPVVPTQPALVLNLAEIVPNPLFDGLGVRDLDLGISAGFSSAIGLISPPVPASGGPTVFDTLLGTFTFKAGAISGQVTHLRATDFDTTDDNITNVTLTVLDSLIADGLGTITVLSAGPTQIPEPSTLVLLVCGMTTALMYRRRGLPYWVRRGGAGELAEEDDLQDRKLQSCSIFRDR